MSNTNKLLRQDKAKSIPSLQSQYIFVALLLGSLVLLGSSLGYFNIISTSSELLNKAETTSRVLGLTTEIRGHASSAYRALQSFMLNPDESRHKSSLTNEIDLSEFILDTISQENLIKQLNLEQATQQLVTNFQTLRDASSRIFKVRVTAHDQYPALKISSEVMLPLRNEILSAISITLQEYREDPRYKQNTTEYDLLNQTQFSWMSTLAEYRLYLTNRLGTFDPLLLKQHEDSVDSYVSQAKKMSLELAQLNKKGHFGFQGSLLIKDLPYLIDRWQLAFNKVKSINQSSEWRKDSAILTTSIIPIMDAIHEDLKTVDNKIKEEYQTVLKNQTSASTKQTYILAGIILLFLVYIVISIKLLQHFIIKPIATMASAMKDEAYHHTGFNSLNLTRTRETQDLIDAFSEMSHQVFKRQDELEYQAMHDSLTSLPNRLMLHQRLDYQLKITSREHQCLTFMMLDLNRFKEINDTLGHHIGDNLLIQVGERISNLLRNVDTVARLGGDEFAVLLPNTNRSQASHVANGINESLTEPFLVNQYELQISASIGIAEYPSDGDDSHTLMQHADVAMYISKREKTGYHFYSAKEDSHSLARLSLGADLKSAIENNQLELHYQAKYLMSTGQIIGAEALLRWNHLESGYIPPETIIEIAEEMGVINELSHWIIEHAIDFCGKNHHTECACSISINLSVQNLRDPKLIKNIEYWLSKNKLASSRISFEITESAMMTNPDQSIKILNKLHNLGVKLSVDDFGTGFSSLAYLKLLPVNELKIDKSFVQDMADDESDRMIVRSTIELSHNLGLKVVAEGIESKDCWDMLADMGCDAAQGYYMSKPLDKYEFSKLIQSSGPARKPPPQKDSISA